MTTLLLMKIEAVKWSVENKIEWKAECAAVASIAVRSQACMGTKAGSGISVHH